MGGCAAKAPGDMVSHGCDLGVGIGAPEGRHRDDALRGVPKGAGDHDLGNIGCGRIVDGAGVGDRGEGRERAHSRPVVATGAGLFEYFPAGKVCDATALLGRWGGRQRNRRWLRWGLPRFRPRSVLAKTAGER
jgi:hypothetical protein